MSIKDKKKIKITKDYTNPKPLDKKQILEAKDKLDEFDKIDDIRIKTIYRKNFLERLLFENKESLENFESNLVNLYSNYSF